MSTRRPFFFKISAILLLTASAVGAGDGDLRDLDVIGWACLDSPSGTAKTQDGIERNRSKNRPPVDLAGVNVEALDTAGFLQKVRNYDVYLNSGRRGGLSAAQKALLALYEKQIVSLTGWLVLAYPGPPETTNCGDRNFHDWHLEVFEHSMDHHPQIGDPTPIICEITPRTEQRIFRDNIRLHTLAGFFRSGKEYQPTGHSAKKIRVTGYLCWDDDHNGTADVGIKAETLTANGYHHPWRSTAWEIHPVIKVEVLESDSPLAQPGTSTPPSQSAPADANTQTEFITISRPVIVTVPYGETVLQPGQRLEVVYRTAAKIRIKFGSAVYDIPAAAAQ